MSVLKLSLLVDLQQKVGELFFFLRSCPSIINLGNALNLCICKSGVMVTLATCIMFLLFTWVHFWVWGPRGAPTAYEVVRNCRKMEKRNCFTEI
jgi:hypothetical protein